MANEQPGGEQHSMDDGPTKTMQVSHGDAGNTTNVVRRGRAEDAGLPMRQVARAPTEAEHADYLLVGLLGQGGRGDIYLARQVALGREVAIKFLNQECAEALASRSELIGEARVTAALDHPYIVTTHEVARDQDGHPFYVMERVLGQPWSELIDEFDLDTNLAILRRVSEAVAYAHRAGVLHLDLKPQNVLVEDDRLVQLIDWGMAMAVPGYDASPARRVTANMPIAGTPNYMAPELARGRWQSVNQATDIYQLGGILFQVLAGRAPHQRSSSREAWRSAMTNQVDLPDDIDVQLSELLAGALATDTAERPLVVEEFVNALRTYHDHRISRELTELGLDRFRQAVASDERGYELFQVSLATLQSAIDQWPENVAACRALVRCQLALARRALELNDLEFAEAQLPAEHAASEAIRQRISQARQHQRPTTGHDDVANAAAWSVVGFNPEGACRRGHWLSSDQGWVELDDDGFTAGGSRGWWVTARADIRGDVRVQATITAASAHAEIALALAALDTPDRGDRYWQPRAGTGYEIKFGAFDGTADMVICNGRVLWQRSAMEKQAGQPCDWDVRLERRTLSVRIDGALQIALTDLEVLPGVAPRRVAIGGWSDPLTVTNLQVSQRRPQGASDLLELADYAFAEGRFAVANETYELAARSGYRASGGSGSRRSAVWQRALDEAPSLRDELLGHAGEGGSVDVEIIGDGLAVSLTGGGHANVSRLADLPVSRLHLTGVAVDGLTDLVGTPVRQLDIRYATIGDQLEALSGAPLNSCHLVGTDVTHLEALTGAPLRHLNIDASPVSDLSFLSGCNSLFFLSVANTPVTSLEPLHDLQSLSNLDVSRCAGLCDLSPLDGHALHGFGAAGLDADRLPRLNLNQLRRVSLNFSSFSDLSLLAGAELRLCHLEGTPVNDLSCLDPTQLRDLIIDQGSVSDFGNLPQSMDRLGVVGYADEVLAPWREHAHGHLAIGRNRVGVADGKPWRAEHLILDRADVDAHALDGRGMASLLAAQTVIEHPEVLVLEQCQSLVLDRCRGVPYERWLDLMIPDLAIALHPDDLNMADRLRVVLVKHGRHDVVRLLDAGLAWATGDYDLLMRTALTVGGRRLAVIPYLMDRKEVDAGCNAMGLSLAQFDSPAQTNEIWQQLPAVVDALHCDITAAGGLIQHQAITFPTGGLGMIRASDEAMALVDLGPH